MKPAGTSVDYEILVIPIPERDSLRFIEYLDELSPALGEAGGDLICWVPIDNPRKIDKAHKKARSLERARRDQQNAEAYDDAVQEVGDHRHHARHEYAELTSLIDMNGIVAPAIVLLVHGIGGKRTFLNIPVEYLDTPRTKRLLSEMLTDSISKQRFVQYKSRGRFTAGSVRQIHAQLDSDLKQLAHRIESGAGVFNRPGDRRPAAFPLPAGAGWPNVKIVFQDRETVKVSGGGEQQVFTYVDMGMSNKRNGRPTTQWQLLLSLSKNDGHMDWKSSDAVSAISHRKRKLCALLKDIFGLEDDPIIWDNYEKSYKCRFTLRSNVQRWR